MKPKFISQAAAKDIGRQLEKMERWEAFAEYAFNKSSTATMDCLSNSLSKANYPAEYGIVVK
jgi:DNA polymerase III alpha subunit